MNEVETIDNKGLLWNLLSDGRIFDNIPESRIDLIKVHFERKIKEVKDNSKREDTLTDLNKKIIKDLMQELDVYRIKKKEMIEDKIVDNNLGRKKYFEETLQAHQNDMSEQLNLKPQDEIDFSDNIKEQPLANKDIEAAIKERENEQKAYVQKDKLSNNLKIGELVSLENSIVEPIDTGKRVTFEVNERDERDEMGKSSEGVDSFMSKLKEREDKGVGRDEIINVQIEKIMKELIMLKAMLNND